MTPITYANETHPGQSQLAAWADTIVQCINPLSEGVPQAWAQIIEQRRHIQFELRVAWYDSSMHEVLEETFTHEQAK